MKYVGVNATGKLKALNFTLDVKKGESYEIPDSIVKDLLKGGEWKEEKQKVEKKKEKKKSYDFIKEYDEKLEDE